MQLAAQFFAGETDPSAMMTITDMEITKNFKRATILINVLPENKEEEMLKFARSKIRELREFLKKKVSMRDIPHFEIEVNRGEKNRQLVEKLLREK